ncbi:hypothetical protein QUB63_20910 [Microcoleus sp. ARI1-B5]|uniref:hypothetical protein n=1 Tax=unclassified Microcoleus TaxID=2642155 RepID=UPI002FD492F7
MVSGQFGDGNFVRSLWFPGWLYFQLRSHELLFQSYSWFQGDRPSRAIDQIVGSNLSVISCQLSVIHFF